MLMSVIARECCSLALPELKGARVLITGLTSASGFDIARAFADQGAHLILQSPEDSPEMTELAAVLAESCVEIKLFNTPLESEEDAVRLVRAAAQDFGGLDAVINLVPVSAAAACAIDTAEDVEGLISDALRLPLRLTEVAANRMRLVWVEGSILNVVRVQDAAGGRAMMLADILRAELAELTRGLAREWGEHGIRINAVAPPSSIAVLGGDAHQASDADLAAMALQLASRKGRSVSGHVLDAVGAARRWC
ncbi:SDR family oxidoreductase [Hyphomicrobium sp.]|uniref:SDR family NAD(P)-dependent oxidoreductase n=1 Tax=Hyphomicrobium sp. TaxID=82 RepID=UPI0025C5DDFA|nr:SDR family oxidoreductase [Hyphomicrobium sp.]MCC7250715.1 SDR family oxidoreductase [Hyphomicrobium sp.]